MHKAVNTAKVDENAEIGDCFDCAFEHEAFLEPGHNCFSLLSELLFEKNFMADNDVFARVVNFNNPDVYRSAYPGVEIANGPDVDLRAGQECLDAHKINNHTAFDPAENFDLRNILVFKKIDNIFPNAHKVSSTAG